MRTELKFIDYAPLLFISAKTGAGVEQVLPMALRVQEERLVRLSTSKINRILMEAQDRQPAPARAGRQLKLLYGTQVRSDPPTFMIYVNDPRLLALQLSPLSWRIAFREEYGFPGNADPHCGQGPTRDLNAGGPTKQTKRFGKLSEPLSFYAEKTCRRRRLAYYWLTNVDIIVLKTADSAAAIKKRRRCREVAGLARMQHEGHADAIATLVRRVSHPVIEGSGGTFEPDFLEEGDAIDRHVLRRSLEGRGRALALCSILNHAHIDVLLHQVRGRGKGKIDAAGIIRLARHRGSGRVLEGECELGVLVRAPSTRARGRRGGCRCRSGRPSSRPPVVADGVAVVRGRVEAAAPADGL